MITRSKTPTRRGLVSFAALLLFASGVVLFAAPWHADAGGQASVALPEYPTRAGLPADVLQAIPADKIVIGVVPEGAEQRKDLEHAVDVARSELGSTKVAVDATSVALAKATTPQYGIDLEPDPSKPRRIQPAIDHELVWVVTFESVPGTFISQRVDEKVDPDAADQKGTVVLLVSAASGKFLYGLAF